MSEPRLNLFGRSYIHFKICRSVSLPFSAGLIPTRLVGWTGTGRESCLRGTNLKMGVCLKS